MTDISNANTTIITTPCGANFRLRTVQTGERFGRNFSFVHEHQAMLIEFYDPQGNETELGTLLTRFFAANVMEATREKALVVHTTRAPLPLDPQSLASVQAWVVSKQPTEQELSYD